MKKLKYKFSVGWQKKLLSLLIIDGADLVNGKLVKPEFFEKPIHSQIAKKVIEMYEEYGVPLTFKAVGEALRREYKERNQIKKLKATLKKLKGKVKDIEVKLITDEVKKFARHQAYKIALRSSIELLEQDNLDSLENTWSKAMSVGKMDDKGTEKMYFSSFSERNKSRLDKPDVLATLIHPLDQMLEDGGFHRGELNMFLGLPSGGKSFALDHMAKAGVIQQKKVVMYTFEMSVNKVASRLDASFSGVEIKELRERSTKVGKSLKKFKNKYGDLLLLKGFPMGSASVGTIRSHLLSLKLKGFEPDVVVIDYINLIKRGEGNKDSSYRSLGDVYIELRALAQELNVWVISAGQSHRGGMDGDLLTMKNIGESFEGAMHSDVIITLNRTEEEKQKRHMRLYIAKNRNEVDSTILHIKTNFAKGSFYRKG